MKCREVKHLLVAYLDGEVMPSERTLMEAHVGECEACARELADAASRRSTLIGSLKTMASDAEPSPQAWIHLQAGIAEEARSSKKDTRSLRKGDRPMKLRWRIALGTAGAVVLAIAVIAAVPSSRAAAGGFFADVFNIQTGPSATLTYLPDGFQNQPVAGMGSIAVAGEAGAVKGMEEALYQRGDTFVVVKTSTDDGAGLPKGEAAKVNGVAAVLQTGLKGTFDLATVPQVDGAPAPSAGGGPVMIQGAGGATVIDGNTVITGDVGPIEVAPAEGAMGLTVSAGSVGSDGSVATDIEAIPVELPTVDYAGANSLTWIVDGTRVELLSNVSVEELQKIADGLVLKK